MKVVKKKQSVFGRLSHNANISLRSASLVSDHLKEKEISAKSILIGILLNEDCLASQVLREMHIDRGELIRKFFKGSIIDVTGDTSKVLDLKFSLESQEIFRRAYNFARKMSHVYVGTEHILCGILESKVQSLRGLSSYGLDAPNFVLALFKVAIYPLGVIAKPKDLFDEFREDSMIEYLGTDLVGLAKKGMLDPVIGRDEEIAKLINVLSRRKKNNPLVVGEAGVGKTVLIEGLAQRIASGSVPPNIRGTKIISLNVSNIMAGSRMRGDIEEKVMSIVEEVISSKNVILFLDEIHNIVSNGIFSSGSDIASILKPALLKDGFRCIGATTSDEYRSSFENDNALARRFQPIYLKESSVEDTLKILENVRPILEKHHDVRISKNSLKLAVNLSDRYVSDRYLPDKAIDLLDEAAASKRIHIEEGFADLSSLEIERRRLMIEKLKNISQGKMEKAVELKKEEGKILKQISKREKECWDMKKKLENEVNEEDIRNVISKWTGIPLNTLGSREKSSLLKLEDSLKRYVVGQNEACSLVSSAIKRARTGLIDADRPWASFLFLGPTGVGKTELAKVLTRELFGDENRLIQVDMSEMMEMHSISKLIGSPPGYVGYQEGGWLTERVRREPHSVILFDEVEKAHIDVLNILLQILEYGHLTDGRGRRVNFKNTVIILTSNIGAEEIRKDKVLGFLGNGNKDRDDKDIDEAYSTMRLTLLEELRETLRPELINRLDDVVIFRSLTRKDLQEVF